MSLSSSRFPGELFNDQLTEGRAAATPPLILVPGDQTFYYGLGGFAPAYAERVKQLNYQVVGKESITVAGKARQATKVTRTDGDKQETVWVVNDLPVPVRILRRKGGEDEMDLRLKAMH